MTVQHLRILLVEDNPGDARLLREMLSEARESQFTIVAADRVAACLGCLARGDIDLILLDLSLPDSEGLETLRQVQALAPAVPVIVLTGLNDGQLAIQAVREGAQDYLVKGQIDQQVVVRAIRYARERHHMMMTIRSLSLVDELTGLGNRRGFVTIAEEQLKLVRRTGQGVAVAFIDLDGMKRINDSLGHEAGDQALVATATILRAAFRASDIVARLGGDEFVVLAVGVNAEAVGRLLRRLQESLEDYNAQLPAERRLAFSVGVAHYDPATSTSASVDELIAEADAAMYAEKKLRRAARA